MSTKEEQTNVFLISAGKQSLDALVESTLLLGSTTHIIPLLEDKPDVIQFLRISLLDDIRKHGHPVAEGIRPTLMMRRKNTILLELTGTGEL